MSTSDRRSDDYDLESVSHPLESGYVENAFFEYGISDPSNPDAWIRTDRPVEIGAYSNFSDVGLEQCIEVLEADYTQVERWSWAPVGRQMMEGDRSVDGVYEDWDARKLLEVLEDTRTGEIDRYVARESPEVIVISAEYPEADRGAHNSMPVFEREEVGITDQSSSVDIFLEPGDLTVRTAFTGHRSLGI